MRSLRLMGVCSLTVCLLAFVGCGGDEIKRSDPKPVARGNTGGQEKPGSDPKQLARGNTGGQEKPGSDPKQLARGNTGDKQTAAAPTGEKITLKLNMTKGTLKTVVKRESMKVHIGGQRINPDVASYYTFTVQDVDAEGNHEIQEVFDRMVMSATERGQTLKIDTNKLDPANREWKKKLYAPYILKLNRLGKRLSGGFAGVSYPEYAKFPDKPVDNGDTWTGTLSIKIDGQRSLTSDITYTLLERKDGEARIGIDGKLSDGRMSGRVTGNLNVDLASGWITSMNLQTSISGVVHGQSRKAELTSKYTPQ